MKLPKAYNQYGASMGRSEVSASKEFEGKVSLQRIRINQGGYDSGGAYWGIGEPLYCACGESTNKKPKIAPNGDTVGEQYDDFEHYFRAADREEAKQWVRDRYPKAKFYR